MDEDQRCGCGESDCDYLAFGYPWCRPCAEHHRPPECAVDASGAALAVCGCPWGAPHTCDYYQARR